MQIRPRVLAAVAATASAFALAAPHSASAVGVVGEFVQSPGTSGDLAASRERPGFFDARSAGIGAGRATLTPEQAREVANAARALRRGTDVGQLQVDIDPATGTPAHVAAVNGFLTGPSERLPESVVRSYLRRNAAALGLTSADLSTFRLRHEHTDSSGVTHLSYEQVSRGITVFGNGLKAHVTRRGELISLQGSPVANLSSLTADHSTTPSLTAQSARAVAAQDVDGEPDPAASERNGASAHTRLWSNGDRADLVWFVTGDAASLAWSTYTQAGDTLNYSHVVDVDGRVLYRNDLVDFADGTRKARVYDNHPGATRGGSPHIVDLVARDWLTRRATWLRGPNVSAWADVDDDDEVDAHERTPVPGRNGRAQFALKPFDENEACSDRYVCTWDPETAYSWRVNKLADVTNAFYLANLFHDWLARPAIGFDADGGNFERDGGDPLLLHALDGANTTGDGLPDANHINNANMSTPPDGLPPTMQMYLLHEPGQPNSVDPYLPTSTSFEASTLYHEYTHGLSNRLVTDASGNSTLNSIQAGAMGEAWSDYYAMDYLVHHGFIRDTPRDGDLRDGDYVFAGQGGWRSQSVDCDVDAVARNCSRLEGGRGGYTYGDFPTIGGAPQVHASGEVWTQTLWDMREDLGSVPTSRLVTEAMRLSPADPSMLDMRNALLQADRVINGGDNLRRLWRIFASRGMGWFAGAIDAGDAFPTESFRVPPRAELALGAIAGTLTDDETGEPISGIRVAISGHGDRYADTTDADGSFAISNVPPGTYLKLTIGGQGYDGLARTVTVRPDQVTNLTDELRRDWAAASGGGQIVAFTGPDYTPFGCGPWNAIDLSQGTGWSSTTGDDDADPTGTPVPKQVDIALPEPITITAGGSVGETAFRVDPTNTCGDPGSSATNEYRIEVSAGGTTWVEVAGGSFGTIEDTDSKGRYFDVASSTAMAGVTHVRFWMDSPQVPDIAESCPGPYGGCEFMDMTEIQVYGSPTAG
jgi:hypothetical protein